VTAGALPAAFAELAPFVPLWSLSTSSARNARRLRSTMAEITTFYTAMLARKDEIIAYLNQRSLSGLPEPDRNLYYLLLSAGEAAPAVEFFKSPEVTPSFPGTRFVAVNERPD
jgi:hypothetical protein